VADPNANPGEFKETARNLNQAKENSSPLEQADEVDGPPTAIQEAAERVDPNLLRWCEWPDCLRSFHAVHGPIAALGWVYVRGTGTPVLLCPSHSNVGHRPGHRDWKPGDTTLTATCECGAEQQVQPTNQAAVMRWWREHIESLNGLSAAGTPRVTAEQVEAAAMRLFDFDHTNKDLWARYSTNYIERARETFRAASIQVDGEVP
jgi:hypothetical protein